MGTWTGTEWHSWTVLVVQTLSTTVLVMVWQWVVGLVPQMVLGTSLGTDTQCGLVMVTQWGLVMVTQLGTEVHLGTDTHLGTEVHRGTCTQTGVWTVLGTLTGTLVHCLLVTAWQRGAAAYPTW